MNWIDPACVTRPESPAKWTELTKKRNYKGYVVEVLASRKTLQIDAR